MKKRILFLGGTAVLVLACVLLTMHSPRHQASKLLGLDLPRPVDSQRIDTHGGWFGDGEAYGTLTFTPAQGNALEEAIREAGWKPLPLSGPLAVFLYGGEWDGVDYVSCEREGWDPSTVTEGYYYFWDRKHDRADDTLLLDANSTNVTVAIYDTQQAVLYFLSYDS